MSKVQRPARHIIGHLGDGPPGNHLQRYGQHKLTAKSIKPTQKKQNTIVYYPHTHAHKRNTN